MINEQLTESVVEAGPADTGVLQELGSVESNIEHAEPTSGGSYMRDLDTGKLIKTAGPATNEQPEQE
ncbi:MAG: hypothetical protein K2X55_28155 [Burkholderiaceae bacterium]|nr:hypothetical protein [Burkholderiaceae bacterium]